MATARGQGGVGEGSARLWPVPSPVKCRLGWVRSGGGLDSAKLDSIGSEGRAQHQRGDERIAGSKSFNSHIEAVVLLVRQDTRQGRVAAAAIVINNTIQHNTAKVSPARHNRLNPTKQSTARR